MELEDIVCDLEYAKELEQLGLYQYEQLLYWMRKIDFRYYVIPGEMIKGMNYKYCVYAPTTTELGVMLPDRPFIYSLWIKSKWCVTLEWEGEFHETHDNKKEANARAKMLIYLLKNKLIKIDEVNKRLEEK
jgi:plasmid maintenance system killer protein